MSYPAPYKVGDRVWRWFSRTNKHRPPACPPGQIKIEATVVAVPETRPALWKTVVLAYECGGKTIRRPVQLDMIEKKV